jgi:hypothetical protein
MAENAECSMPKSQPRRLCVDFSYMTIGVISKFHQMDRLNNDAMQLGDVSIRKIDQCCAKY